MSRSLVRAVGVIAAAAIFPFSAASAASPPSGPEPLPPARHANAVPGCPLERIGRQLVRCDSLTGAGVSAPLFVPVQRSELLTQQAGRRPVAVELAQFAAANCSGGCGSGSTVGPDGALYVTDGKAGRVLRIDPETGATTTFASGLPPAIEAVGIGGAIDVAFLGRTAYVLVTLVGPSLGQPSVVDGLYRVGRDGTVEPVADIGAWSIEHPPAVDVEVASGVQYAMQRFGRGFLVSDGHHNRIIEVTPAGAVREVLAFGNTVPTGIDVAGGKIFLGEAGPVPHRPETGRVVSFTRRDRSAHTVVTGVRMVVDVEFGPHQELYVLSQGVWDLPNVPENAGLPASPHTGRLLRLDRSSTLTPVVEGLDRPTSVELINNTAFVITLSGKVIRIDGVGARGH